MMKQMKYLACGLMLISLACGEAQQATPATQPALTQPSAEAPAADVPAVAAPAAGKPGPMREYWAQVAQAVPFTDEQNAKLEEHLAAIDRGEAAWEQQHGADYQRLEQELAAARDAGDSERIKSLRLALAELDDKKGDVYFEHDLSAVAKEMLAAEQRPPYIAARMYLMVLKSYEAEQLNEEQQEKVRQAATRLAPRLLSAGDYEREQGIGQALLREVYDKVLTEEQKTAFEARQMYDSLIREYGNLGLSTQQIDRMKAMCDEVAKATAEADTAPEQDKYAGVMALPQKVYSEVLTTEQRAEQESVALYSVAVRAYRGANLDYQQRQKIQELCRQTARQLVDAGNDEAKAGLAKEMFLSIYRDMLSDEQKDAYETDVLNNVALAEYQRVALTGEQREQIEKLAAEEAKQISVEQDNESRNETTRKFVASLAEKVLTDQQRMLLARAAATQPIAMPTQPATQPIEPALPDAAAPGEAGQILPADAVPAAK